MDEHSDCDVCCSNENVPAYNYFKYGQKDGLRESWFKYNYCNPPFDECKKWVQKAYGEQFKGNTTIMLIPVRTETAYWHDYILYNKYDIVSEKQILDLVKNLITNE